MALSLLGDEPVEVKEPVVVSPGTTLRGTYRSAAASRSLGSVSSSAASSGAA